MLNRNLSTVVIVWILSVGAAITLFLVVDATIASGEFLGFKVAGGLAGAVVIFLLLFRSYCSLNKSDLQIFFVFDEEVPKSLEQAEINYQITYNNKMSKAKPARIVEQLNQRYIVVPEISFDDYVQVSIVADNGTWISDKIISRIRHLKFRRISDEGQKSQSEDGHSLLSSVASSQARGCNR